MRVPSLNPLLAALLAAGLFACSDDPSPTPPGTDTDTPDTTDAGDDATEDTDDDVTEDTTPLPDADAGTDTDVTDLPDGEVFDPCTTQDDCAARDQFCIENFCRTLPCRAESQWAACANQLDEIEPDLGRFSFCTAGKCTIACIMDDDCDEGESCTDFGVCRPFTGELTGIHPGGDARAPLQVGLSNVLWNYPIGVPLGGYGERAASNDGRYAVSLRASWGNHGGLWMRGMALDAGDRQFLFLRAPMIFAGQDIHEAVARALQERTGADWRSSLIISATHTHSGPARHWPLPEFAALSLGAFGIGEYSEQFYIWLRDSLIETAFAALDNLEPARLGWEIVEAYDMRDEIGRDRWAATPPFDDNRVLLIRVDDMDGIPRAVLMSFAAHGTDNSSDYATNDVLGGPEHQLELALGERYGRFVQTMFINQNSGSISPAGGVQGHRFPQTTERIGWAFNRLLLDNILDIETSEDLEIGGYTHRFPITYDLMGYERGQFAGAGRRPAGGEFTWGGLSCVGPNANDRDFSTHQVTEQLNCAGALHFLLFNRPATTMANAMVTAGRFRQGDRELNFLTMPGELAMELSWEVLRDLRDNHGVNPLNAWTFGYANGHMLYLMPTNLRGERPPFPGISTPHPDDTSLDANGFPNRPGAPDDYPNFAFSWFQGGYETTMSPWGPLTGDYFRLRATEAWRGLISGSPDAAVPSSLPISISSRGEAPFPIDTSDPARVGTIVEDMPATVTRFDTIEFAWIGGDPGAEMPQVPHVVLERLDGDGFVPHILPNQQVYSNREPYFMTRVRRDGSDYQWVIRWEELQNFPTGSYRFSVNGKYLNGATITPYSLVSRTFEVVPFEDIEVTLLESTDTRVRGIATYPAAENMTFGETRVDPGSVSGHFRMRDPLTPPGTPGSLWQDRDLQEGSVLVRIFNPSGTFVAEVDESAIEMVPENIAGRSNVPRTYFTLALDPATFTGAGAWRVDVLVTDMHGNTGETSYTINR